jgi:hypothetical protein
MVGIAVDDKAHAHASANRLQVGRQIFHAVIIPKITQQQCSARICLPDAGGQSLPDGYLLSLNNS